MLNITKCKYSLYSTQTMNSKKVKKNFLVSVTLKKVLFRIYIFCLVFNINTVFREQTWISFFFS